MINHTTEPFIEAEDIADDRAITITVAGVTMPNLLMLGDRHRDCLKAHFLLHALGQEDTPDHAGVVAQIEATAQHIDNAMRAVWC